MPGLLEGRRRVLVLRHALGHRGESPLPPQRARASPPPSCVTLLQAIPIWVTSVAVPLIATLLRIGPGSTKELAHNYLSHFGEPNVLLMLGGFTLGRALQKLQIDRLMAGKVLSRAGSKPLHFLAAVMVACFVLSMALNNVVAPVLMIMVTTPPPTSPMPLFV